MKVKVEKQVELNGDSFFMVYADNKLAKAFFFSLNNEEEKRNAALSFAKQIEAGELKSNTEIIYETPEP